MKIFNSESSNPMFNDKLLDNLDLVKEEKMTVTGTVNKTIILLLITVVTAFFSWQQMLTIFSMPLMFGVIILGIILVVAGMKNPQYAYIIAPIFAFVEGLLIGVISAMYASVFEGIVANAALLTFGTLFLMLFVYKSGLIKVTDKFRMVMTMAIGAIGIMYLASWIGGFMGFHMSFLHDSSPLSIGISLVITIVASLTLLLDFDMIEKNVRRGAPKSYEWVGSMALLVTLVWLYLEFLRLLSKLSD